MEPQQGPKTLQGNALLDQLRNFLGRLLLSRRLAFIIAAMAVISGMATFGLFTGTPTGTGTSNAQEVLYLLYADLVILLLLGVIIAQRVVAMWARSEERRVGKECRSRWSQ